MTLRLVVVIFCLFPFASSDKETVSSVDGDKFSVAKEKRYLIFDVSRGEGFNLRRDVYIRIANAVRLLRESGENFHLVLPPWGGLKHWDRQEVGLPWSRFFDLGSLNEFVPVMEFEDYLKETGSSPIDHVVYLQKYKEGWGAKYEYKFDRRECNDNENNYTRLEDSLWKGWFFSFDEVRAREFECISIQGDAEILRDLVLKEYPNVRSLFFDRAETIYYKYYGQQDFWAARRSMRYAPHLLETAAQFRKENFGCDDESDKTVLPALWKSEVNKRAAKGGNYVCAHWRRRDFVRGHGNKIPSIEGAAKTLNQMAKTHNVSKIFIATDASESELSELQKTLTYQAFTFRNVTSLSDGEIAIVDQIICSRARFFTGTHMSTVSFRIQEDREILGFDPETTFNRMCPDGQEQCDQPGKWMIVR